MRRRKIVKKGFRLTLMVCGHSGMGKSTFINTLCEGDVYPENSPSLPIPTMDIGNRTVDLNEPDGTIITLSVVDTPGFGDSIDNSKCCSKIIDYLKKQFDEILEEESRVKRNPRFIDNRVHVALYFIAPTGHGLRELDIEAMIALSSLVNVIPIIAKADTLTSTELSFNKKLIMQDIKDHNIPIYYFPCDPNDDEGLEECIALRNLVPFAIVGSNEVDKDGSEFVRVRSYPGALFAWKTLTTLILLLFVLSCLALTCKSSETLRMRCCTKSTARKSFLIPLLPMTSKFVGSTTVAKHACPA